ncbi:solute carrier family 23 member 1-like isoform X2 [Asterias amurensis]|uniref:solute carrier family 23 member 1-like isoform X2 n=1 Tax=Asterias amurensis TaxID=7602 RepID=UPI003AB4DB43
MAATNDFELEDGTFEQSSFSSVPKASTNGIDLGNGVDNSTKKKKTLHGLVYGIEDMPPWYTTFVLGLQHFMTSFGGNVSSVLILAPYFCIDHDAALKGQLIGTVFVVNGLVTILQCTIGVRLPIIQGASFALLVPTIAILQTRGECLPVQTDEQKLAAGEDWLSRIREIQGAIMVASCVQVVVGATGVVGLLMNFIGPLAITPTITLIGLSLHQTAALKSGAHWGISVLTTVLIIIFSQFLPEVGIPFCGYNSQKKCHVTRFKLFKVFPIILAIATGWLCCFIFTVTGVFPDVPNENTTDPGYGYRARTDLNSIVLESSPWFYFPYPGQWGTPTLTLSSVLGIVAGTLASIIESVGDYYACARLSGAPAPPKHAINRGIVLEGIGCILAGAWGTGNGTTSYSENVGAIGLTKVGSRVVVLAAGCIMVLLGLVSKLSALFASIPDPVVGGVLCVTFAMVTAVGLSNLQYIDLNSSRNLFIVGFSILMGLVVPHYLQTNPGSINTGSGEVDQVLTVILSTGMFIGGFLGILLDNTIPGTKEERGFTAWREHITGTENENDEPTDVKVAEEGVSKHPSQTTNPPLVEETTTSLPKCYDLPFGMRLVRRWTWCSYLPFSPTFKSYKCPCIKSDLEKKSENNSS